MANIFRNLNIDIKKQKKLSERITELYPNLLRYATHLVKSRLEGQELLHQALFDIMSTEEKMDKLYNAGSKEYLCARIMLAIKYSSMHNSNYSRNRPRAVEFRESQRDIFENIQSKLSSRVDNEQIDLLISRLPDFESELLLLWCMPDFSYKQAAIATGLSEKALVEINHRSINKIRKYVHRTTTSTTGEA